MAQMSCHYGTPRYRIIVLTGHAPPPPPPVTLLQVVEHLGFETSARNHLSQVQQTDHQVRCRRRLRGDAGASVSDRLLPSCPVCFSLTYSCDGHHLYTANSEGTVMAWCRRDQQRMKLPMFYSFLSSYAAG